MRFISQTILCMILCSAFAAFIDDINSSRSSRVERSIFLSRPFLSLPRRMDDSPLYKMLHRLVRTMYSLSVILSLMSNMVPIMLSAAHVGDFGVDSSLGRSSVNKSTSRAYFLESILPDSSVMAANILFFASTSPQEVWRRRDEAIVVASKATM